MFLLPLTVLPLRKCYTSSSDQEAQGYGSYGNDAGYDLTWNIDQYLYAANSGVGPEDPSFSKTGGIIYLIIVHSGSIKIGDKKDMYDAKFHFDMNVDDDKPIKPALMLPESGTGVKSGDEDYEYAIDFSETLQMIADEGSNKLSFQAAFKETFVSIGSTQKAAIGAQNMSFTIEGSHFPAGAKYDIHALSVFQAHELSLFPAAFSFTSEAKWGPHGEGGGGGGIITIDPEFKK
ncbi:hypothetical protein HGRIS_014656 [Hohenbuehelia grisea]|uniref:Uncharacterized protein n=1 Tax=Hohenbuehelia grisea TaxID=104357 RepID=A0ABR3JV44_9AGAR